MEELKKQRSRVKAQLTRLENQWEKLKEESPPIEDIEFRQEKLRAIYNEFQTIQNQIDEDEACSSVEAVFANDFEERYFRLGGQQKLYIKSKTEAASSSASRSSVASNSDVGDNPAVLPVDYLLQASSSKARLPLLSLPVFSGRLDEWPSFINVFTDLIHNDKTLSVIQKMQYLKGCVRDEASKIIQHLQVTEEHYASALALLTARYDDRTALIRIHMNRFFNQPPASYHNAASVRRMIDCSKECLEGWTALGGNLDHLMISILSSKLDEKLQHAWEFEARRVQDSPTFESFCSFLEHHCKSMMFTPKSKGSASTSFHKFPRKADARPPIKAMNVEFHAAPAVQSCSICRNDHRVFHCTKFKEMTPQKRRDFAKNRNLCFNCLCSNHSIHNCPSKVRCYTCKAKHHTMLHTDSNPLKPEPQFSAHFGSDSDSEILLPTAIVKVRNLQGNFMNALALLDSGSHFSFISERLATTLGLPRQQAKVSIAGIGSCQSGFTKGRVHCNIQSHHTNFNLNLRPYVLPKLTNNLPHRPLLETNWNHLKHLPLANPKFMIPQETDFILGSDVYPYLMTSSTSQLQHFPFVIQTALGWVVSGPCSSVSCDSQVSLVTEIDINDQLRRFWDLEEPATKSHMSAEEAECEQQFCATQIRDPNGRFVVSLPFKSNNIQLGASREFAVNRFHQVERRMNKNVYLKKHYLEFMEEYQALGHMVKIHESRLPSTHYYMPHHAVIKESSSTTKVRVVFDASAKTSSSTSLNEKLLVGPKLQQDLFQILLRFRTHKIAITADIAKMYRQVAMDQQSWDFQRIVWRSSPDLPLQDYQLTTVTYGTASAPFQAVRCLVHLARAEASSFPLASRILLDDFYVDDVLTGAESTAEAIGLKNQLSTLLEKGCFHLRKWSSNSMALLDTIPVEEREFKTALTIDSDQSVKSLGLYWHPRQDALSYTVELSPDSITTKRKVLSDVARIFDPLGLLAPVIITAKILLQSMWTLGSGWDEQLPETLVSQWHNFRAEAKQLELLKIPRHLTGCKLAKVEIHGFCDASEKAYAACIYVRSFNSDSLSWNVTLLCSKTKVAPIKRISLPRLELSGSLLLVRLMKTAIPSIQLPNYEVFAWTDSTIALAWIQSSPHRWKTFVANRVSEIQETLQPHQWRHVSSEDNPADCASRGISVPELIHHPIWWHGPSWLQEDDSLPENRPHASDSVLSTEEKSKAVATTSIENTSDFIQRFSSLTRLKRVTAYCFRFIKTLRKQGTTGPLTSLELKTALEFWVKETQRHHFSSELNALSKKQLFSRSSSIAKLHPFIDHDGLLRVGGRLQNSQLTFDQRHPILLPKGVHLSRLIIHFVHLSLLH